MFPFGRHAPQPSPPAYSGLSAFAPPFNLGYAHSDHPYPSYPAAASSTPIPPSPCVGPYHSYYPPPPSSSGASMTSFGADFGGAGLNRWDESYYGNYGSNSAWMDHQPNLDSLMFGKGIFFLSLIFPPSPLGKSGLMELISGVWFRLILIKELSFLLFRCLLDIELILISDFKIFNSRFLLGFLSQRRIKRVSCGFLIVTLKFRAFILL